MFVKNLPPDTDEEKLKSYFAEFGEIESVFVERDESKSLKDYGYVCFKVPEDAERAQEVMNKKALPDN